LGSKLFIKAFDYLKSNRDANPSIIRDHLIGKIYIPYFLKDLFGKNNIGFWQIMDQILFLEELMNS
jgi:hypothetical protein